MKTFNLNDRLFLLGLLIMTLGMSTSWADSHIMAGQSALASTASDTTFDVGPNHQVINQRKAKVPAPSDRKTRQRSGLHHSVVKNVKGDKRQCRGAICKKNPASKKTQKSQAGGQNPKNKPRQKEQAAADKAVQGSDMAWKTTSGKPIAEIGVERSYTKDGRTLYYVVNSVNKVSGTNPNGAYALVIQNGQLVKSTQPADQEYQADVTISPCKDLSCGDTQTTVLPPETLQNLQNLTATIHRKLDKNITAQNEIAACKIDQDGNKLSGDDKMNCFGKQVMKKRSSEQLAALKDIIRKNISSDLGSLDPDKRAKALDELSTLADAVSTNDKLWNYMNNLQKYGQTMDRLLTLAKQRADIPNLPPYERAAALMENNAQIDQAMRRWNNLKNLCDFGMKNAYGLSCSSDETAMADGFRNDVMTLARNIEISNTNPYDTNSTANGNGFANSGSGDRTTRWNINTGGVNLNNRGFGNPGFANQGFGNGGLFNRGFGAPNTAYNSPNFAPMGNFQQNRYSIVNNALGNNGPITVGRSQFTVNTTTPALTGRAQIRPAVNASLTPDSPASFTAPYFCRGRGPGYCVGGVS